MKEYGGLYWYELVLIIILLAFAIGSAILYSYDDMRKSEWCDNVLNGSSHNKPFNTICYLDTNNDGIEEGYFVINDGTKFVLREE